MHAFLSPVNGIDELLSHYEKKNDMNLNTNERYTQHTPTYEPISPHMSRHMHV